MIRKKPLRLVPLGPVFLWRPALALVLCWRRSRHSTNDDTARAIEEAAETWIVQNSLFQFTTISKY